MIAALNQEAILLQQRHRVPTLDNQDLVDLACGEQIQMPPQQTITQ
jgi:hypothetical protein